MACASLGADMPPSNSDYGTVTTSPKSEVHRARSVWGLILSPRNCTCPSPNSAFTPPGWKLNGSSFGPQLLSEHGQVVGPPFGAALLLIRANLFTVSRCGPETPLATSGSPQR